MEAKRKGPERVLSVNAKFGVDKIFQSLFGVHSYGKAKFLADWYVAY